MKLVFAHDHIFKKDADGNYYTSGAFNNTVWKRYLKHFDSITVVARLEKKIIDSENTYNKFDLKETNFTPIPSLSGPINQFKHKKEARQLIAKELKDASALIARLPSEIGNLAIRIAKEMDKPYLVEVVGCVWDALWNYGNMTAKLYAPIAMYKMKKRIKESPYAIYVTSEFLQKRYPCYGLTENISNVELRDVSQTALKNRVARYEQNQRLYTIGMIGSLKNNIKGWDIAFRALAILKSNNIDFKFKILGDGDPNIWIELLKKLDIEDRVEFCGVLPGGKPVLNWLDDIDVYIQPSYQEGLPRAVIEAMSRGCPVIGSTAGGIPELINKRCIHIPGDYKQLSNLLIEISSNIELSITLAKENIIEANKYKKSILDFKRDRFITKSIKNY